MSDKLKLVQRARKAKEHMEHVVYYYQDNGHPQVAIATADYIRALDQAGILSTELYDDFESKDKVKKMPSPDPSKGY